VLSPHTATIHIPEQLREPLLNSLLMPEERNEAKGYESLYESDSPPSPGMRQADAIKDYSWNPEGDTLLINAVKIEDSQAGFASYSGNNEEKHG
jgi:hypothetical protein